MSTRDHPDWWRPVGGANSQESVLERRSRLWNDGNPTPGDAPPGFDTGTEWYGKLFPRGARGLISELSIYARAAAAGSIILDVAPTPCTGPLLRFVLAPGVNWAWVTVAPRFWWNYDSLFVWIYSCDADVEWAWDEVQPFDMHHSPDLGYHWIPYDYRPFIRLEYAGETPGDVPISGTVNTVEIPNFAPITSTVTALNVPPGNALYLESYTYGFMGLAMWYVDNDDSRNDLCPSIRIDGHRHDLGNVSMLNFYQLYTQLSSEGFQWGQWDAANHRYALWLKHRLPFRNMIGIGYYNAGAVPRTGYVWFSFEQLT